MAKILIVNERRKSSALMINAAEPDDESYWVFNCMACGQEGTVRGHFEDTVVAAEIHVDIQCEGSK